MEKEIEFIKQTLYKWKDDSVEFLPKLFLALLVLCLTYFLAKSVRSISEKFYGKLFKNNMEMVRLISAILHIVIIFFGGFLSLEILGLESVITKILAGAGIVGIIAGFAFKDIASNAFAGFLLNMQKPFSDGDWVTVDDNFGTITTVGLITTSIKTVTGEEVFVPNQLIYNQSFVNYSTYKKRRVVIKTGVSYGDDLERVKEVALDEISKMESLLSKDSIDFYFTEIGGYSYNFELRFWIRFYEQTDFLSAQNEAIIRIKKRFEEERFSIAYPVQTLDFDVKGGVNIFDKNLKVNKT
ncbi:mechanosensitive ion channel family protein [uncultured Tenacibaculum sp.]|uniref:mechanosensitive ion channel family protein n=1 Tax=uncultured Tenacibaculum sp. TaxID=174713 RepID=UPI002622EA35|nr:mechanosensitive ion channel family protein [uncultured Tenacibaculum sp.]